VRALVQRVSRAVVTSSPLEGAGAAEETGRIGQGLVVFVGVTHDDDEDAAKRIAEKVWRLRVFDDDAGVPNRSCEDIGGGVLVVSQFTLYADARKGRRPSYVQAARPEVAEPLLEVVMDHLRALGATVATGRFRTHMDVELVNDGPWTLMLEV
jgi:D-aminoacyl-tRNA deacylase